MIGPLEMCRHTRGALWQYRPPPIFKIIDFVIPFSNLVWNPDAPMSLDIYKTVLIHENIVYCIFYILYIKRQFWY